MVLPGLEYEDLVAATAQYRVTSSWGTGPPTTLRTHYAMSGARAAAVRCPVLTSGMLLPGGTEEPLFKVALLVAPHYRPTPCSAMSSTDVGCFVRCFAPVLA
eukprot:1830840-Rhodomonas_salina.4